MAETTDEAAALRGIVAQLDAAVRADEPIAEGLRHQLEAADLSAEARQHVSEALTAYTGRRTAQLARRTLVESLLADGYPDLYTALPPRPVPVAVVAELHQNLQTIQAAFGQFEEIAQVTGGVIILGDPVPKTN